MTRKLKMGMVGGGRDAFIGGVHRMATRQVVAEYPQGWLIRPIDAQRQKQAAWRTNPEQAGASACVADIGTHAENLARYITGLSIEELCADFTAFVEGRRLEDAGLKSRP